MYTGIWITSACKHTQWELFLQTNGLRGKIFFTIFPSDRNILKRIKGKRGWRADWKEWLRDSEYKWAPKEIVDIEKCACMWALSEWRARKEKDNQLQRTDGDNARRCARSSKQLHISSWFSVRATWSRRQSSLGQDHYQDQWSENGAPVGRHVPKPQCAQTRRLSNGHAYNRDTLLRHSTAWSADWRESEREVYIHTAFPSDLLHLARELWDLEKLRLH